MHRFALVTLIAGAFACGSDPSAPAGSLGGAKSKASKTVVVPTIDLSSTIIPCGSKLQQGVTPCMTKINQVPETPCNLGALQKVPSTPCGSKINQVPQTPCNLGAVEKVPSTP